MIGLFSEYIYLIQMRLINVSIVYDYSKINGTEFGT